jgi:hypothetical protein
MSLTIQELKDKIEMVNKDIQGLRGEPGNDHKASVLADYIEYLKDELKEAELAERSNKGT